MSSHKYIYLGYYFDVNPIEVQKTTIYNGCPKCETKIKSDFCSKCGSAKVDGLEHVEIKTASVWDICDELGEKWEDFVIECDPITGENSNFWIVNYEGPDTMHLSNEEFVAYDIQSTPIPKMSPEIKEFLKVFRKKYGINSIKEHYGLIIYYA